MLKTHLFSRSYFTDCFQRTSSEHCTVPLSLAMLQRLINCRFIIIIIFYQGGSKITKENYETCLEVNPTLAGRYQRNHHAVKPN